MSALHSKALHLALRSHPGCGHARRSSSGRQHPRRLPQCGQCLCAALAEAEELPEVVHGALRARPSSPEAGVSDSLHCTLSASNSAQELADALLALGPSLSPADVAAAWEHLARRRRRPGFRAAAAVLPLLGSLSLQTLPQFSPDQLGSIARSCTLLGVPAQALLPDLLTAAARLEAADYSAPGFAELAWAAAAARQALHPEVRAFLQAAVGSPKGEYRDWGPWFGQGGGKGTVVMLLWSLAALDARPCPQFWDAAAARLRALQLGSLSTKSVVTLLWALGALRSPNQRLMAALSRELTLRLEASPAPEPAGSEEPAPAPAGTGLGAGGAAEAVRSRAAGPGRRQGAGAAALSPRRLGLALWACGRLRHRVAALLRAAVPLLQYRVQDMGADDVARVLWGLGRLQHCPPDLLAALCARLRAPAVLPALLPSQLATAAWALAALDYRPGEATLEALAGAALAQRPRFDPEATSELLWNLGRLGRADAGLLLAFAPDVLREVGRYRPPQLADLALVYAGLGGGEAQPAGLLEGLAAQMVARMEEATMQDIVRIVEAFHGLGLQPEALLAAVEGWADRRLGALTPQALSLALWNFARLGNGPPRLLRTATACVEARLDEFEVEPLARVVWSLAKLGQRSEPLLAHAAAALARRGEEFGDKAASNVLWALASLGHRPEAAALDAIAARLQPRLRGYGAQSLSNIGWAYATFGHRPQAAFLQGLGDAAKGQIRAFEPLGLSLLVWSLAKLGHRHNALLLRVVGDCAAEEGRLLREFEGQHLANLVWGVAKVGFHPGPDFLRVFARAAEAWAPSLRPQEVYNIAWAYAALRFSSRRLMAAVSRQMAAQPSAFSPQEVAGTLWAFARLRHRASAGPVIQAAQQALLARAAQFEGSHLARVMWSLGELRHAPEPGAAAALLGSIHAAAPALTPESLTTIAVGMAKLRLQPGRDVGGALVARALALLPSLKPYEYSALLAAFAELSLAGSAQLLAQRGALEAAAAGGPITSAVELVWVMARSDVYPEPAFSALCARLKKTSPGYHFSRQRLAQLGSALRLAAPPQAAQLKLRSELRRRALAAAAAGAGGSDEESGGEVEEEEEADSDNSGPAAGASGPWFTMSPSMPAKDSGIAINKIIKLPIA